MATELTLLSRVAYRDREINGPRLRGLLALLAGAPRTGCSTAALADGLWPERRPEHPAKAVQVLVSRARAQLGADLIVSTPVGYRLRLAEDEVDASAVLRLATAAAGHARTGDHTAALAAAEAGLALWDGVPEPDADPDDPVAALRGARDDTRRALRRIRGLALARLGRRAEAFPALVELGRERPRDEEVLVALLGCEAVVTGPAAALARYDAFRRALRAELGTEPGQALRELHLSLLREQAPAVRNGVAHEPNPLLGRDADVAAVAALLRTSRVTSIVGPGGLGKTRLAQTVAMAAEQRTVHLVGLAGMPAEGAHEPADVLGEVAAALGVGDGLPGGGRVDLLARVLEVLGPALLVLDNCEHVVRGAAETVRSMIAMSGELRVLTTSRAPLGLSSESVYALPELSGSTMAELFERRARAARAGVELPAAAVAALCRHLDGLPLAAELAAARVRVLSVTEIARRLDDRFALLRGGPRDAPRRHRTLQAVIEWSWNLLDARGRAAMRALSVFPDGFTAAAAGSVLAADADAEDVLADLVDQSLLKTADTAVGLRFRQLETVREFSAAQRDAVGETAAVTDRFLGWARELGRTRHDALLGAGPVGPVHEIRAEQDNLAHALRLAVAGGDGATALAAFALLAGLWNVEGQFTRVAMICAQTGELAGRYRPAADAVEVARTALGLAVAHQVMIEGSGASRMMVALRRLPPAPPDTLSRALAVVLLATLTGPDAVAALGDSPYPLQNAVVELGLGYHHERRGDLVAALAAGERVLRAFPNGSAPWLAAMAHGRITEIALQLERGDLALRHIRGALPLLETIGARGQLVGMMWWLVQCHLLLGELDEAERWMARAVPDPADDAVESVTYGLAVRAEIQLARGAVEPGLADWRRALDGVRTDGSADPAGPNPWAAEVTAAAVVAHARHGRSDLLGPVVDELPGQLTRLLAHPLPNPPPHVQELPTCGALLLAEAMLRIERGRRTGDRALLASGAGLVALAERFHFLRTFHPTMSSAQARTEAGDADGPAYDAAVASYAGLPRADLRAAALAELSGSAAGGTAASTTGTRPA